MVQSLAMHSACDKCSFIKLISRAFMLAKCAPNACGQVTFLIRGKTWVPNPITWVRCAHWAVNRRESERFHIVFFLIALEPLIEMVGRIIELVFSKWVLFLRSSKSLIRHIFVILMKPPLPNIHRFLAAVIGVRISPKYCNLKLTNMVGGITSRKYDRCNLRKYKYVERVRRLTQLYLYSAAFLSRLRAKLRRVNHSLWEFYAAFYCIFSAETKFVRVCHNVSSPVGRSGAGGFLSQLQF